MHFDTGAIHRNGFNFDANDLLPLQLLKDFLQHTTLRPSIHPGIDGVPVTEAFG